MKSRRRTAFWITLAVFLGLEALVRILPAEYAARADIFFTNYRKNLAEASLPEFDYIILGDSRSLSLMGHAPTPREPYSMYNFSMPALGSRYFRFFLRKYLKNRKRKPAAVIFAGDPGHFTKGVSVPHHDPKLLYSNGEGEPLSRYLKNRVVRRVEYALRGGVPGRANSNRSREMVWSAFSHRYLHLFDMGELHEQYTGAERVFILREAFPLLLHSYKFRDSIREYTFSLSMDKFRKHPVPDFCRSCAGLFRDECHPNRSNLEDNRRTARILRKNYGQVNLGDRLNPAQRFLVLGFREGMIQNYIKAYQNYEPDLKELEKIIKEVNGRGIKLILTEVPTIDAYRGTRFFRRYDRAVARLLKRYPNARRIRFPRPYYPRKYFLEQVHYECEGARVLNRDFYGSVVPEILRFAPPDPDPKRRRGFQGTAAPRALTMPATLR